MKPFKIPILILAILDLVLICAIPGAAAWSQSCTPSALGMRPSRCPTSDDIFAFGYYALLALMVLVPFTAVLIILSEVLGWRRTRRVLDDTPS